MGNSGNSDRFSFLGLQITADSDYSHDYSDCSLLLERKGMTNSDILKAETSLCNKGPSIQKAIVFPVFMYGCESWTIKKTKCWKTDAFKLLGKTLEGPLDCKEIKIVKPERNQPWILIGRNDAEAKAPILWPPDMMKKWLLGKDPEKTLSQKDWGQEEKGVTEDEMAW